MTERLSRIVSIVRADFLIRFRRISTLVVFLLLSAIAYAFVPDPSTGRALLQSEGRRAIYNSAAIGMATAALATIFVGLVGFYVVSNAIGRDVVSRCGFVIASTTVRTSEYLVGKLLGNIVFLATFASGFMLTSMAMLLVRGEAGLEPGVFLFQYLLLLPPSIVFVSVLAILFESVPFLSGRIGDVVYFFLWMASMGLVAMLMATGLDPGVARYFDFSGFGFLFDQIRRTLHTSDLSIGSGSFDPTKPVFVFPGLTLERDWILPRIGSLLTPLPLLALARLSFHRFDPARVRQGGGKGRRGWMPRIHASSKPLVRVLFVAGGVLGDRLHRAPRNRDSTSGGFVPSRTTLLGAASTDARMTIAAYPAMALILVGLAVATMASPSSGFAHAVLPIALGAVAVAIADIPCRERRAGTLALTQSAPLLKSRFVGWKLLSTSFVAIALLAGPLARLLAHPASLAAFAIGIFFMVSLATALGVISANPKTFIVVFLTFWYVVLNDKGSSPAMDFAGFYGKATPLVSLGYAATALASLVLAETVHAARLRREN